MEISKKTDYALRMLAVLAKKPDCVLSVRAIAEHEHMPYSFTRAIQRELAQAGITENVRGASGGMRLKLDPRDISLLEIIEALQGPVLIAACGIHDDSHSCCELGQSCHYLPTWCNAELFLKKFFSSVSLYELVCERKVPVFHGSFDLVDDQEIRHLHLRHARESFTPDGLNQLESLYSERHSHTSEAKDAQ